MHTRWFEEFTVGDTLISKMEVLETRPSRSRSDRGSVHFGITVANQEDVTVLT